MERKITAKNGVEIYTYKNPALHSFYISLFLRAGSMYESADESGMTHFLEHTLVRNVNKLYGGTLYSTLDSHGMEFNASTFSEMVQFYVFGGSHNFSVGAEVIASLLEPLTLTADEISAERKRIKAEIRESDERGSLSSFTAREVFSGTTLAASILGTNKSVDRVSARRLEEYRRRAFVKENVFLYVTGSFTDADIEALAALVGEKTLATAATPDQIHTNVAPVSQNFGKREGAVHVKPSDYTVVRFTFDMDMSRVSCPEADLLYDLLLSGYASPFFIEMSEERGLFYDISGATERYKNIGTLHFTYEVKEKKLYDAVALSVEILNSIKKSPLPEEKCMKAGYVDNAYLLFDDAREFNFTLAYDNHIMDLGYRSLDERIEAYKKITPERLRAVACEIFTPENLTLTLKGNKKKIDVKRLAEIIRGLENYSAENGRQEQI